MCLIAYASHGRRDIPDDHLKNGHTRNNDAWGIMYAEDGKITILKDTSDHEDFRLSWDAVPHDIPVAAHFRFGTSGSMTREMAHPFPILKDADDNITLAVMHNGVLHCVDAEKRRGMSDTAVLIYEVIQPMLVTNPHLVRDESWRDGIGNLIGNPNKLLFMQGDGQVFIVNDWQGEWRNDKKVWYSNTYSIEAPKVVTTNYGKTHATWDDWVSEYYGSGGSAGNYQPGQYGRGYMGGSTGRPYSGHGKGVTTEDGDATPSTGTIGPDDSCPLLEHDGTDPGELDGADGVVPPVITYEGGEPFITSKDGKEPLEEYLERKEAETNQLASDGTDDDGEDYPISPVDELLANAHSMSEDEICVWVYNNDYDDIVEAMYGLIKGRHFYG